MMTSRIMRLLLVAATVFGSCHTTRKAIATAPVELNELKISARNNPNQVFRSAAPRVWDITATSVGLSFNYKERSAKGKATIFATPYLNDTNTLVLDAKGMKIDTVAAVWYSPSAKALARKAGDPGLVPDVHYRKLAYTYDGAQLKIRLPEGLREEIYDKMSPTAPVKKSDWVFYITYTALPYADTVSGGSAAIQDDRGLYFINSDGSNKHKPVQIWTQGETESNSHWLPTIDKPNERFPVTVTLTVPDTMQTLSNGEKIGSKTLAGGLRQDVWKMDKPIQPYAIMFAIGRFSITKDEHPNGVPVEYYVEPQFADAAKDIFRKTPQMIDYFSATTGVPYPWNKYSQVVVRDYVSGAMENTSASLFGEFMNGNSREVLDKAGNEDVVSHELFHQWFGDYVTARSWSNLTLNESFATYGEVLWRRHSQGQSSADELAWEDQSRYVNSTETKDPALVRYYYRDKEDMFDRVSYQKGGAILRYINGLMGDEAFSRAMQLYLTKNALQPAEAADWRKAIEAATGTDWTQFFNEWYLRGGHPVLNVTYNYNDSARRLIVNTRQQGSPDSAMLYNLPLKAAILENGKLRMMDWNISRRTTVDTILYSGNTRPVFIPDYYHWLPGSLYESGKTIEQAKQQLAQTGDYNSKRRAIVTIIKASDKRGADGMEGMKVALNDSISRIRYNALTFLGDDVDEWKDGLRRQVEFLASQDGSNTVRAQAFRVLGQWKSKGESIALEKTAVGDPSYLVAGAALRALTVSEPDTAYKMAQELLRTDTRADAEDAALNAIALKGKPEDLTVFSSRADRNTGVRQVALANNIFTYAYGTTHDSTFSRALDLLSSMLPAENIGTYRGAIGSLIFYTEGLYSGAKTKEEKATAARRAPILKQYEDRILAAEKDPKVSEQYRIIRARQK